MTIQLWCMYLALVIVATSTPGPAVLFITTNSTLHGWRKALYGALGNIVGLFCLGLIVVTGLGSVISMGKIPVSLDLSERTFSDRLVANPKNPGRSYEQEHQQTERCCQEPQAI